MIKVMEFPKRGRRGNKTGGALMRFLVRRRITGGAMMQFLAVNQFPAKRRKAGGHAEFSKRRKVAETSILDLPFDLTAKILSRLPMVSIFRCKSVCKLWKTYFSDPEFFLTEETYLHHTFVLIYNSYRSRCVVAQLKPREAAATIIGNSKLIIRRDHGRLVGSCNGLVCLLHSARKLSVSNPMTREFRPLPPPMPKAVINAHREAFLFGFSGKTGEYKVLRIHTVNSTRAHPTSAQICTVNGSNDMMRWRAIVGQRVRLPSSTNYYQSYGVTFNGALHWITKNDYADFELVSFDLAEEKIAEIPLPTSTKTNCRLGLGVLSNRLCIFQMKKDDDDYYALNMWTMKEYGVMESWTKETVNDHGFYSSWCNRLFRTYHPFVHCNDNQMVTIHWSNATEGYLALHDRKNGTTRPFKKWHQYRHENGDQLIPYVPNFIPLDHLLSGKR